MAIGKLIKPFKTTIMKKLLFLFCILPLLSVAQKYALIDRDFRKPIVLTDNLQDRMDGAFIIHKKDATAIIQKLETFTKLYQHRLQPNDRSYIEVGNSNFVMYKEKDTKYHGLMIVLNTRAANIGSSLELVHLEDGNRLALQKLLVFLDYLRNNKVVMEPEAKEAWQ